MGYTFPMTSRTDILILQPPLVQLNTAYPAGAYLKSFFSQLKEDYPQWSLGHIRWVDCCNRLFHRIFCRQGLAHIFSATEKRALAQAERWEQEGRHEEVFNVRRYLSQKEDWIRWIDAVVAIVQGQGRELCHDFVASPAVPRGQRMENFMAGLDAMPTVDEGVILASLALADVADYIAAFYDTSFQLVRYGESLAASHRGFEVVEQGMEAPVLRDFYQPVVADLVQQAREQLQGGSRLLVCVSCPFPGTLAAALYTCRYFKKQLGDRAFVVMGGGYVNTELRQVQEPALAVYLDGLSYDRGYGSYWDFFRRLEQWDGAAGRFPPQVKRESVYKLRFFCDGQENSFAGGEKGSDGWQDFVAADAGNWQQEEWRVVRRVEEDFTARLVPDFSDIDLSRYPRLADSTNPMHRLWSDGAWLKAYLAHGCYWHQCAFCDTSLDYVCGYQKTNVPSLHESLYRQAYSQGAAGIHLVDEAAPPSALRDFALENLRRERPLVFWGNIRYEKVFTRDLADLLSHGGLRAVSGGIEIASGTGLDAVHKGTDLDSIVSACAAFKEAGILTHAYMIYGYWMETPQLLIDSMETLRQLFAAGLLDSAFWHKFVLTRHSRVFQEWRQGMHPELVPLDWQQGADSIFATNDLRFQGEEKSRRYGGPLNTALSAWMLGQHLERPVQKWFPFPMPRPSVSPRLVEESIARYEARRDEAYGDWKHFSCHQDDYCWLGGRPFVKAGTSGFQLCWTYMGELLEARLPAGTKLAAEELCHWLLSCSPKVALGKSVACDNLPPQLEAVYQRLRTGGLCRVR